MTSTVDILPLGKEWNTVLQEINRYDIFHTSRYCQAYKEEGYQVVGIVVRSSRHLTFCPYVLHPILSSEYDSIFDARSPYGYAGPISTAFGTTEEPQILNEFITAAGDVMKEMGVVTEFTRLHPWLARACANQTGELVTENIYVDLTRTTEQLWWDYTSPNRRAIKRSHKLSVTVTVDSDWTHLALFQQKYLHTMNKRKALREYHFFPRYFEMLSSLGNESILHIAWNDDSPIGMLICVGRLPYMHTHLMYTEPEIQVARPANRLYHEAIRWAQEHGYQIFHLGGGSESIRQFKSNFSDLRVPFYVRKTVIKQETYDRLCNVWAEANPARAIDTPKDFFPLYRS